MYVLTKNERNALIRYQDNDFKIINTLLRPGFESELRINNQNGQDYPYMTKEMMDNALTNISDLYSAIMKKYVNNGCVSPDKPLFRGTQVSLIDTMNNNNSSFLSTTTNIFTTNTFSKVYPKGSKVADESEKAVLSINGSVPWIDIDEVIGGCEGEILFVPAKTSIVEADLSDKKNFGKEYIMTLTEIDIPRKSPEEIEEMRTLILDKTKTMSEYLKYILEAHKNPTLKEDPKVTSIVNEYNNWKNTLIEYNYQQYRLLREKIIDNVNEIESDKKH